MRTAPITFTALDEAPQKSPRFVVGIIFEVDSLYVTSHAGIENVPGTVIDGALAEPSIVSQKLKPDDAAAEIGSASFALVDLGGEFTAEVRERLNDGAGLRGKQVRFYLGYEELGFEDYQLVGTQIISGVSYEDGRYRVECLDIQRSLRSDIFELQTTTLAATISATDTTITLTSTTGLHRVQHGPSYSDAPNERVGYVKIKSEVIRYTNIVGNQLTGCTRGVFGTVPEGYNVDPATQADRREKVSEYVYLELPAIKLAYALLTGIIHGSAETLPPKWHLGIAPELIRLSDYAGIGADIWNPSDDTAGLVVSFQGLAKQDGKRFLEKELYLLMGVYSPVYANGTLGLRRAVALREDAATVLTLDDGNSVQVGALTHDMGSVYNAYSVNWSWNGEEFRRTTAYIDPQSREKHGAAETRTLNFKGLRGGRHTDAVVLQMLDMIRDRYAGPPLRTTVDILHSLNKIEVGDIVRGRWRNVRDFSGETVYIDRAFEVQSVSVDHRVGRVSVELFGSTAEATAQSPTRATVALSDGFYASAGTPLASAPGVTISNGVLTAASQVLVGAADMNAGGAIYFHDGDLTIANGVTLQIAGNVQLRVRGFLQVHGFIDGRGRGHPGVPDDGRTLAYSTENGSVAAETIPGLRGYVGTTRGYDGIRTIEGLFSTYIFGTWPAHLTTGANGVAPRLLLTNSNGGTRLDGIPADLRGGGGGPGGRIGSSSTVPYPQEGRGGTGGNGGAGFVILCRGMAFGASGAIDLSGNDSAQTASVSTNERGTTLERFPGAGAGGGPGTCYVLLDGANLSQPDFTGSKFRTRAGSSPVPNANALQDRRYNGWVPNRGTYTGSMPRVFSPVMGFSDAEFHSNNAKNYSGSALQVQYVPGDELPVDDTADRPSAPVSITTQSAEQASNISIGFADYRWDTLQLYASIDDDRSNAVKVSEGKFDTYRLRLPDGATRRLWARTRNANGYSVWYPESPTNGVLAGALGGLIARGGAEAFGTTANKPLNVPAGWNADVYSAETFASGAYVSFQAGATTHSLMVGLNSDPETDSNYTSLDHAWYIVGDGHVEIYEGGVSVGNFGSYTTNTVFLIRYDGQQVQYFKDSSLVRTVARVGASFFIDSSFNSPGASIKNLKYGPLGTAPSIPWVARGYCVATASTIRKVGGESGINGWDSDAHSFEAFRGGAFVSFQADQTNLAVACGLNSDPTTDLSYTSIDYAWVPSSDGNCYIFQGGAFSASLGAYTTSTVFSIAYDGRTVRFLKDGLLIREVYAPDQTFYFDASFSAPSAAIRNVNYSPYGAATPVPFLARSTSIIVSENAAQKLPGTSAAWDADFISINGYPQCFVQFKSSRADTALMVGLNADPYTDQSYTSIDAAWYPAGDGVAYIYEHGSQIGSFGAYTPETVFAITFDGTSIRYYKDRILVRTVSNAAPRMFLDASFHSPGAAVNSLRFGPGTIVPLIDTSQLGPNAATDTYSISFPGLSGTVTGTTAGYLSMPLISLAFTPKHDGIATVTNTFEFMGSADVIRKAAYISYSPSGQVNDVGQPNSAGSSVRVAQTARAFFSVYKDQPVRVGLCAACDNAGDIARFYNMSITAEVIKA